MSECNTIRTGNGKHTLKNTFRDPAWHNVRCCGVPGSLLTQHTGLGGGGPELVKIKWKEVCRLLLLSG